MATALRRHEWQQTAAILQKLHNANCTEERQLVRDPAVFMPPDLATPVKRWRPPPADEAECAMLRKQFPKKKKT